MKGTRIGIGSYALDNQVSELTREVAGLKSTLKSIIEEIELDHTPEEIAANQLLHAIYTHAKSRLAPTY